LLRKVESIRHAVVYLGLKNLRVWASIILMAKIEGKPVELMKTSLVRARMCEELAQRSGIEEAEPYFTVGLLSTLDVLLDAPMQDILKELPVTLDIQRALQYRDGALGQALQCVLDYEAGQWGLVDAAPYAPETVLASYVQALAWAEETAGQLTAA
jgi:EAL and modified HD-GYP domain-containing signal transduction protein